MDSLIHVGADATARRSGLVGARYAVRLHTYKQMQTGEQVQTSAGGTKELKSILTLHGAGFGRIGCRIRNRLVDTERSMHHMSGIQPGQ